MKEAYIARKELLDDFEGVLVDKLVNNEVHLRLVLEAVYVHVAKARVDA